MEFQKKKAKDRAKQLSDLNTKLENQERDQQMSGREHEMSHDQLHEIEEKEVIANQRVARGESAIPQDEEKSDGDSKEATRLQREQEEREFLEKLQSNRGTGSRGGDGEDQAS